LFWEYFPCSQRLAFFATQKNGKTRGTLVLVDKKEIREKMKVLCLQNKEVLAEKSALICKNILSSKQFVEATEIFVYMPLPDEVDLTEVIKTALQDGKKVALPKIISKEDGIIKFFYLDPQKTLTQQTAEGTFGILEPDETLPANPDTTLKTLILVPGRAFTKDGARLGRGKGYYDRYLAKEIVGSSPTMTRSSHHITLAGVCFDFQIKKSLPTDDRDIKMDVLFTSQE
jgi:5-formyltetrahydrofolate cyclo-ligase